MLTMHQTEYSALGPFVPPGPHACCSYSSWRTRKICGYPESLTDLVVDIGDPRKLLAGEGRALINCIRRANVAIYRCADPGGVSTESIAMLGRQLGLTTPDRTLSAVVDGIAAIEVRATGRMGEYIPYTDRPINWHTDGYYDAAPARIQAFIMHCARPAVSGGANRLLDADMVYIALRDANPAYVEALMRPDVMTIPANIDGGQVLRPEVTGPVFARAGGGQALHMRFTRRTKSIRWHADPLIREARDVLYALLDDCASYVFRVRLNAGEGIIANNVLHTREAFIDSDAPAAGRLVWRARYRERVGNT